MRAKRPNATHLSDEGPNFAAAIFLVSGMKKHACLASVAAAVSLTAGPLMLADEPDAPATQPQSEQAEEEQPAAMLKEANYPAGWPAPTPVGEIRFKTLPSYRVAYTTMDGQAERGAFGRLFRHIKTNDIKMTAPVRMDVADAAADVEAANERRRPDGSRMGFLYGEKEWGDLGDKGDQVEVVDEPEQHIVSTGVRGPFTQKQFADAVQQLNDTLANSEEWEAEGDPFYMGYNSPMVPASMRYTEVAVPVRSIEANDEAPAEAAEEADQDSSDD